MTVGVPLLPPFVLIFILPLSILIPLLSISISILLVLVHNGLMNQE